MPSLTVCLQYSFGMYSLANNIFVEAEVLTVCASLYHTAISDIIVAFNPRPIIISSTTTTTTTTDDDDDNNNNNTIILKII